MKEKLNIEFQKTIANINVRDWKLYNINTLRNFIVHFDSILESEKENVHHELNNYILFIKNYKIDGDKKERIIQANQLYVDFLSPLLKFYLPLGFRTNFSWVVALYFMTFTIPIMLLLKCNIVLYLIPSAIIFSLKLHSWIMARKNKTYGPVY